MATGAVGAWLVDKGVRTSHGPVLARTEDAPREHAEKLDSHSFLKTLTFFLFNIAIPATVWRGVGLQAFDKLPWVFVGSFVVLRVVTFLIALAIETTLALTVSRPGGAALIVNQVLTTTLRDFLGQWLNTIIFGIPLVQAAFGPKFVVFCVFAAISSFIFQLPLQLVMLEVREQLRGALGLERDDEDGPVKHEREEEESETERVRAATASASAAEEGSVTDHPPSTSSPPPSPKAITTTTVGCLPLMTYARILWAIIKNPVIIGVILGHVTSAIRSGVGDTTTTLPIWLETWLGPLGDTVTPLAAVGVGAFAVVKWKEVFSAKTDWLAVTVNILAKLLLMPLLALVLLPATGTTLAPQLRVGVVISSLPAALSSYVLSTHYNNKASDSVIIILIGTVLMIPATYLWTWAVDPEGGKLVAA
jgi:predicted permease